MRQNHQSELEFVQQQCQSRQAIDQSQLQEALKQRNMDFETERDRVNLLLRENEKLKQEAQLHTESLSIARMQLTSKSEDIKTLDSVKDELRSLRATNADLLEKWQRGESERVKITMQYEHGLQALQASNERIKQQEQTIKLSEDETHRLHRENQEMKYQSESLSIVDIVRENEKMKVILTATKSEQIDAHGRVIALT